MMLKNAMRIKAMGAIAGGPKRISSVFPKENCLQSSGSKVV
jgi:hypothetical protein